MVSYRDVVEVSSDLQYQCKEFRNSSESNHIMCILYLDEV